MQPSQLNPESFSSYPPKGRKLAVDNVDLLRALPLSFAPFLLREMINYDWKFPAEQREFDAQIVYLRAWRMPEMNSFAKLQLGPKLEEFDWVNSPAQFLERLSAHLWATHQTDQFRSASDDYIHRFYASLPPAKLPMPRLGIVVIGQGVDTSQYALFRKVRKNGVWFRNVNPQDGLQAIISTVAARADTHPAPYAHWYVDGGAKAGTPQGVTTVAYQDLAPLRGALAAKMLAAYESPKFDPEALRTALAVTSPESIGLAGTSDATLDRFQLSLLTEGSGTQIYSTTFVQWTAREVLRRAQPLTLLTRYSPRQRERTMDELLAGTQRKIVTDPQGSLVDADMGAYYTWINQQRLSGADNSRFLVWFEGHGEAFAIAPAMKPATGDVRSINMPELLKELAA